jgi:dephospho-CoA kinase
MTFRVLAHFGPDFALKGESAAVDRSKLAGLIFSDERARRELGELMHPAIRQIAQIRVDEARSDPSCRLVAEEIPLLYENRLQDTVDYVLVAVCGQDEQVRRLTARQPGATEVGALRQIGSQMPLNDKVRMADFTIDTGQTLDEVRREAGVLYDRLAGISAKRG